MSKDKKQKDVKDEKVETEVPETENAKTEPVEEVKETELETARREASEYKDLALRRMAELENFRRNNQNLAKDVRDRTLSEVILQILPAIDSFNRAGVTPIDAIGKDFDPAFHECIMQVDSPDKVGKVIYEIEKGYTMNGKVLKYTKVAVGKEIDK